MHRYFLSWPPALLRYDCTPIIQGQRRIVSSFTVLHLVQGDSYRLVPANEPSLATVTDSQQSLTD